MPDRRKHRGPHPDDERLFGDEVLPRMQEAVRDLTWLFERGYGDTSSLKIVGDRYDLASRQRTAVLRCTCTDEAAVARLNKQVGTDELAGREFWIDGFNVLVSLEAALSGGVILDGRDGCYRDMASMHGSYRHVEETRHAAQLLGELLAEWKVAKAVWLLDQPVSNSGRLKTTLLELARQHGWNWEVRLEYDPDSHLLRTEQIVATSDSMVLDGAKAWVNLARIAIDTRVSDAWIVRLDV